MFGSYITIFFDFDVEPYFHSIIPIDDHNDFLEPTKTSVSRCFVRANPWFVCWSCFFSPRSDLRVGKDRRELFRAEFADGRKTTSSLCLKTT